MHRFSGRTELGGFSPAEMVTDLLGAGVIRGFLLTTPENPETTQAMPEGSLSNLLI